VQCTTSICIYAAVYRVRRAKLPYL